MGIEAEKVTADVPELPPDLEEEGAQKPLEESGPNPLDVTPEDMDRLLRLFFQAWAAKENDAYFEMDDATRARLAPDLAAEANKIGWARAALKSAASVGVFGEFGWEIMRRLLYRKQLIADRKAAQSDQEGGDLFVQRT